MSVFASCFGGTRFVILVLATSCLTLVISNASVFNFAVICMHNQTNSADDSWLSTPSMVNSLFASPAIGAFLFTFPLSFLITKFGLRLTFTLYCFSSAISTVLFPIAVQIGFPAVFLARFLQGIATALSFTATAQIAAQWTTEKGGATYISILTCHLQIAGVMSMLITAAFCESFIGWSGAFYFHGVGSVILFAVFLIYYRDDPKTHGHVSSDELASIQEGKALTHVHEEVPYKAIFMDPCVWGIWLSMAGATVGFLVLIIYGPIYINRIIGLDVASTGMATAIPNILALILKFILGPISDSANCVSQRVRLIILASVSQFITAAFMLLMAYVSISNHCPSGLHCRHRLRRSERSGNDQVCPNGLRQTCPLCHGGGVSSLRSDCSSAALCSRRSCSRSHAGAVVPPPPHPRSHIRCGLHSICLCL